MPEDITPSHSKLLEMAVQIRNFEIDLFWKRSLFFWGFISAAFVAYAALRTHSPELGLVVACFGVVCSCAWTLLNPGSKYWQESWEQKVGRLAQSKEEKDLFVTEEDVLDKGWWLTARKYSVTKLVIAFSDYIFLLWLFLLGTETFSYFTPRVIDQLRPIGVIAFIVLTAISTTLILTCCRKSQQ